MTLTIAPVVPSISNASAALRPQPVSDNFRKFASEVLSRVGGDEVVLLTTMPRGGLEVCRRLQLPDGLIRRYNTELHRQDKLAWKAITAGLVAEAEMADGSLPDSPLAQGMTTLLAVRIDSPVFSGYAGLLLVLRRRSTAAKSVKPQAEAEIIRQLFDQSLRSKPAAGESRQFIFDAVGTCVFPPEGLQSLDSQTAARVTELAAKTLGGEIKSESVGRVCIADARGVLLPVEVVRCEEYAGISAGPVAFLSIHPNVTDWSKVDDSTFEADSELSRLGRAVTFMVEHFREGPTLESIADSVQLSQFHFHRRFSDLFGVTPKNLLFDLQIDLAKRMLADPANPLSEIAKTCGFAHQSHFTSRFKQGAGITPTRWRRQVLQSPGQYAGPN